MTFIMTSALLKPKFLVTTHTAKQTTSETANVSTTITGSEITYTPYPQSSKVIYEISFYATNNNITTGGECAQYIKLEEYSGSSWSEISATNRKNFGSSSSTVTQYSRWLVYFRFVLPTWSGSKQLRLTVQAAEADEEIDLHEVQAWEGSWTYNNYFNTNLLVYSI